MWGWEMEAKRLLSINQQLQAENEKLRELLGRAYYPLKFTQHGVIKREDLMRLIKEIEQELKEKG
jgi:regulator of replication initiation timing